jgi:hypothetical protein
MDTSQKQQQERDAIEAVRELQADIPTVSELMADPCTPFWVSELLPVLLRKDACDVAGALELLSAVFGKRATDLVNSGR